MGTPAPTRGNLLRKDGTGLSPSPQSSFILVLWVATVAGAVRDRGTHEGRTSRRGRTRRREVSCGLFCAVRLGCSSWGCLRPEEGASDAPSARAGHLDRPGTQTPGSERDVGVTSPVVETHRRNGVSSHWVGRVRSLATKTK